MHRFHILNPLPRFMQSRPHSRLHRLLRHYDNFPVIRKWQCIHVYDWRSTFKSAQNYSILAHRSWCGWHVRHSECDWPDTVQLVGRGAIRARHVACWAINHDHLYHQRSCLLCRSIHVLDRAAQFLLLCNFLYRVPLPHCANFIQLRDGVGLAPYS